MANVLINDEYLSDIADAIREKNGTSDTYKTNEMATAIRQISTDGLTADDIANETYLNMTDVYLETATQATKWSGSNVLKTLSGPNIETVGCAGCSSLVSFNSDKETVTGNFEGCAKLRDVGDSDFVVSPRTFYGCSNLTRVKVDHFEGNTSSYLNVPYAFAGCASLEKIDVVQCSTSDFPLNKMFVYEGTNAYDVVYDYPLEAIIFRNLTSRVGFSWESIAMPKNLYFYVPTALYDTYINYASSTVVDRIRKIEDYPDICNWEEAE